MHFLTIQFYGEEDSDILKVEAADQDDKSVSKQEFEQLSHIRSKAVNPTLDSNNALNMQNASAIKPQIQFLQHQTQTF